MIKNFQRKAGLIPDGIVGPNTAKALKNYFGISTNEKAAHFLGQCAHESKNFTAAYENLNYSAKALREVFGNYFPSDEMARQYAYKPEAIANIAYGNRNGNNCKGEGWKYRGRGAIQLTGKNNYERFANKMGNLRILSNPDLVATEYFFESALFYFNENRIWPFCEQVNNNSILTVSRAINLGNPYSKKQPNHLDDRITKTYYYLNLLNK